YCSATALIRRANQALPGHPGSALNNALPLNAKKVCDAAAAGDALAKKVFDEYVTDLAQVVASMVNMLDPDVIALGGGVAGAGEFLLKPLREQFPRYVTFFPAVHTEVMAASLGNDAGIIGAAMLGNA
ncbi:MAG: ROK family protein, partial [Clostridia bacterium]|nr:ROK family protein [Clostridia bacterium]